MTGQGEVGGRDYFDYSVMVFDSRDEQLAGLFNGREGLLREVTSSIKPVVAHVAHAVGKEDLYTLEELQKERPDFKDDQTDGISNPNNTTNEVAGMTICVDRADALSQRTINIGYGRELPSGTKPRDIISAIKRALQIVKNPDLFNGLLPRKIYDGEYLVTLGMDSLNEYVDGLEELNADYAKRTQSSVEAGHGYSKDDYVSDLQTFSDAVAAKQAGMSAE
jgi:hypothetical protein